MSWSALAQLRDTLVLLMPVENAAPIAEALIAELGSAVLAEAIRPPAITIVGEAVSLRGGLGMRSLPQLGTGGDVAGYGRRFESEGCGQG